jgi:hypothetical protein
MKDPSQKFIRLVRLGKDQLSLPEKEEFIYTSPPVYQPAAFPVKINISKIKGYMFH